MTDQSDILVISLSGEFDIRNAEKSLWPALAPSLDKPQVVLDFSNVSYLDSIALGVLIRKRKIRAERGFKPAHLVGLRSSLRRVFTVTNLDRIWHFYDSQNEAVEAFKRSA